MSSVRRWLRELARRNQPFTVPVGVESVDRISAGFLRVTVRCERLDAYTERHPADAFKLLFPPAEDAGVDLPLRGDDRIPYWPDGTTQPVLRAFTVRCYDETTGRLAFDVADHESGYAMSWLRSGPVGSTVALSGMRREFAAGEGIDHQVLIGDTSSLPAIAAIVESLPPGPPVTAYLQVHHAADRELLPAPDRLTAHWVADLATGVVAATPPSGRLQVWLAAEATAVRRIRRHVLQHWEVARDDLHASAYWKSGHDNTQFDAVQLTRYQAAVAEGQDILDPDVREALELQP